MASRPQPELPYNASDQYGGARNKLISDCYDICLSNLDHKTGSNMDEEDTSVSPFGLSLDNVATQETFLYGSAGDGGETTRKREHRVRRKTGSQKPSAGRGSYRRGNSNGTENNGDNNSKVLNQQPVYNQHQVLVMGTGEVRDLRRAYRDLTLNAYIRPGFSVSLLITVS
nr:uncharacterized protein LOC128690682 [Cherax quadricarinatus]